MNNSHKYDEIINHHMGCSYCEHRCKYYQKITSYCEGNVDVARVYKKLADDNFSPRRIDAFLNSATMQEASLQNTFEKICVIGYILGNNNDLNNGQKQKIIADYLRYICQK